MTTQHDLLIELGTEELPPKALLNLRNAFLQHVVEGIKQHDLHYEAATAFATPRRLAILITGLVEQQPDKTLQRKGPALQAAYDKDGNPTKAASGFARSCGVAVDDLQRLETEQGAWLVFESTQVGQPTTTLIPGIVDNALTRLPIPKRMTWGSLTHSFVRPAHWLVLLYGDQVVAASLLGLTADRITYGHRFHAPQPISLGAPAEYVEQLRKAYVLADFDERRDVIRSGVNQLAEQATQGSAFISTELLDEVTGLVEWPVPLKGRFDEAFLSVPQEALISAMQEHQKYFPVLDNAGSLLPCFITVANLESQQPQKVIEGNERVIRPRLADARFFFETDKKKRLEDHNQLLSSIVFEKQLGTLLEKSQRVATLAAWIAEQIGAEANLAQRAGLLCKADLVTAMVGEFPELQGIMGRYYAQHDGEHQDVALALDEQYRPRFSGDILPDTLTGCAVAIADKADTLVGILGIGKHPTGDKDPYALRRAALGLLRIIIGKQLPLDLHALAQQACQGFADRLTQAEPVQDFMHFVQGRYQAWFNEEGIGTDILRAVMSVGPTQPFDLYQRVLGVRSFQKLPEAAALAEANKRVSNILAKAADQSQAPTINASLLESSAEKALAEAIQQQESALTNLAGDYTAMLISLAALHEPINTFFNDVMVNVDDSALRQNRLAILATLRSLFLKIADISQLSHS